MNRFLVAKAEKSQVANLLYILTFLHIYALNVTEIYMCGKCN